MFRVNASIEPGLIPNEKVVKIKTVDGVTEEVTVSAKQVEGSYVNAACIHIQDEKCLIELPRESASGRWRIWVPKEQIVSA